MNKCIPYVSISELRFLSLIEGDRRFENPTRQGVSISELRFLSLIAGCWVKWLSMNNRFNLRIEILIIERPPIKKGFTMSELFQSQN